MYKHFTLNERFRIDTLLREDYEQEEIAEILGRTPGSISREISRNSKANGEYRARYAHSLAKQRRKKSKINSRKIENNPELVKKLEQRLDPLTSPETVVQDDDIPLCFTTIYYWVYRSRPDLKLQLPYQGKKRRKYGKNRSKKQGWTQHVKSIDEMIETSVIWEGDTIKGSTKSRLLTHVEQKSLFTRVDLIPDGTANEVHSTIKKNPLTGSIIYDRGSEFALWQMIERDTDLQIYFAHAHSPWERPKNENTNGRLRRIFPKKFNFDKITQKEVDAVVRKMNHTKRKSLGWRTPYDVFMANCTSD